MRPLAALLLSDGRAGHYQRAEGIVAAIARLRPIETARLDISRRRWLPGRALAAFDRAGMAPAMQLKLGYGIDASALPRSDVVVSSGGNTLAANIACARLLRATNIFYGGLRRFSPENFALVLTSYGGHQALPRHRMTPLMPVPLDPDEFAADAAARIGPDNPPRVAGLLIGGDAGTFQYEPDDWQRLLAFIGDMHAQHGTRWIVANSPRTPNDVSERIARHATGATGPVLAFIDVRAAGVGTLRRLLEQAQAVICTGDSSAMITEAIWLRRPVVGVSPRRASFAQREGWYRAHLAANGWTRTIPIAELSPERVLAAFAEIAPLVDNPLDGLAATIKACLPELLEAA